MNHIHFSSSSEAISCISAFLAAACRDNLEDLSRKISVIGSERGTSYVDVVDSVATIATRTLYSHVVQNETTALDCQECRKRFLGLLKKDECAISLRIMDILRQHNIASSCEYTGFDPETKNTEVHLRKNASLVTQQVVAAPKVYFGPFDQLAEVEQRKFAISSHLAQKHVLATWHLADCIAVAGFDKAHKIGFLFHIDTGSNVSNAVGQLLEYLEKFSPCNFEYRLLGGSDCSLERIHHIEEEFKRIPGQKSTRFTHLVDAKQEPFETDSYWSRAWRLSRSIAIDLQDDDPLANYMAYEPEINPHSCFHKRQHTVEEANRFCYSTSPKMKGEFIATL